MEHKPESIRQKNKRIVDFNSKVPIGTPVIVTKDNGEEIKTTTRSDAQLLGGHTPVVFLDRMSGCYALNRVRVVE